MKILVLGSGGQLGQCLYDQLKNTDHEIIYSSRSQINVANFEATKISLLKIMPSVIVNATAYTAVDKAEDEYHQSNLINHDAVLILLIHVKKLAVGLYMYQRTMF